MRILIEDTAFLSLDNQSRLFPSIFENEKLEINLLKLISGMKVLDLPILVTEQYSKAIGSTIPSIINLLADKYHPIEKMAFSCMDEPNFVNALKAMNRKNVIICGIESHVCVLQTTIDMLSAGYQPIIIEDCVSSRNPNDKKHAIRRMARSGAIITTYESILFELQRFSGTDRFKAISKIIK
ncbi:MAG: hydrolase [bacterium]